MASKTNDFQFGIEWVRRAMSHQKGVEIEIPKHAFNKKWEGPDICKGHILSPSKDGKFVAIAKFEGEDYNTYLTSSSLMLCDSKAKWRDGFFTAKLEQKRRMLDSKHKNAYQRSVDMIEELLRDKDFDLTGKNIVTLDGMGTNKLAYEKVLSDFDVPSTMHPRIITFELDSDVALAQRSALGSKDVFSTNSDPFFSSKSLFGGRIPKIEHILSLKNRVLTDEMKQEVVMLNLDYCGGPPLNHSPQKCSYFMETVIDNLPNLRIVAFTIARRGHKNLDSTFDDIVKPPYGFYLWKTYIDNVKVICKVYKRNNDVRNLVIPGYWWKSSSKSLKKKTFSGIVRRRNGKLTYDVYVPYDKTTYSMRKDALQKYRF